MLGLMFGQTNVTSKLISYDLSIGESNIYLPIDEFIGFELERGSIQFVGFDGEISNYEYGQGEHLYIHYYTNSPRTVLGGAAIDNIYNEYVAN